MPLISNVSRYYHFQIIYRLTGTPTVPRRNMPRIWYIRLLSRLTWCIRWLHSKLHILFPCQLGIIHSAGGNIVSSEPWIQTPLGRAIPWRVSEYDSIAILAKVLFGRSAYRARESFNKDCYWAATAREIGIPSITARILSLAFQCVQNKTIFEYHYSVQYNCQR